LGGPLGVSLVVPLEKKGEPPKDAERWGEPLESEGAEWGLALERNLDNALEIGAGVPFEKFHDMDKVKNDFFSLICGIQARALCVGRIRVKFHSSHGLT
jgi:hypothetical protein